MMRKVCVAIAVLAVLMVVSSLRSEVHVDRPLCSGQAVADNTIIRPWGYRLG